MSLLAEPPLDCLKVLLDHFLNRESGLGERGYHHPIPRPKDACLIQPPYPKGLWYAAQ
jgi:hypothetical protein